MAGKQPSLDPIASKKRAATPVFVPKQPKKKRRAAVRRTHSPKNDAVRYACMNEEWTEMKATCHADML